MEGCSEVRKCTPSPGSGRSLCFAARIVVFTFSLFFSMEATAGQRVEDEYKCPVNPREVIDLFSQDNKHVWISIEDHTRKRNYVLRSGDGGRSWLKSKVPHRIVHIYFVDPKVGWAVTIEEGQANIYLPHLLRSNDGGRSWQQLPALPIDRSSSDGLQIVALAFMDAQHGWLIGSSPSRVVVYGTTDGGATVRQLSEISGIENCLGMYASREAGLWIYGNGFALNSRDEGQTWKNPLDLRSLGTNESALSVSSAWFFPDGRGFLAGTSPMILSTKDFGKNWRVALDSDEPGLLWGMAFWNDKDGCVTGPSNHLTCTRDGGATWGSKKALPKGQSSQCNDFYKLVMLESGRGWAVRDGGFIYETGDFGQTWRAIVPLLLNGNLPGTTIASGTS